MPIRGIDSIATVNAPEVSREVSNQTQRVQNAQEFSVERARIAEEHEEKTVGKVNNTGKTELRTDERGAGHGGSASEKDRQRKSLSKSEITPDDELFAGYSENEIDIEI